MVRTRGGDCSVASGPVGLRRSRFPETVIVAPVTTARRRAPHEVSICVDALNSPHMANVYFELTTAFNQLHPTAALASGRGALPCGMPIDGAQRPPTGVFSRALLSRDGGPIRRRRVSAIAVAQWIRRAAVLVSTPLRSSRRPVRAPRCRPVYFVAWASVSISIAASSAMAPPRSSAPFTAGRFR